MSSFGLYPILGFALSLVRDVISIGLSRITGLFLWIRLSYVVKYSIGSCIVPPCWLLLGISSISFLITSGVNKRCTWFLVSMWRTTSTMCLTPMIPSPGYTILKKGNNLFVASTPFAFCSDADCNLTCKATVEDNKRLSHSIIIS